MTSTMKRITAHLSVFLADDSAQDLIEYALVAAIIALGSVAAMSTLASGIATAFSSVGSKLTSAV